MNDQPERPPGSQFSTEPAVILNGMSPAQAVDLIASYMVSHGYVLESHQSNSATFSYHGGPDGWVGLGLLVSGLLPGVALLFLGFLFDVSILLVVMLLLLGLLPGIFYFLLAKGDRRTTLLATQGTNGCSLYIGGDADLVLRELYNWLAS